MVAILLTAPYEHNGYNIRVKDTDEYSFLCLLQDLEEEDHKQNVMPAPNLVIKYYPPEIQQLVEVTCDVHLINSDV